jgi:hypothetical protein
MTSVAIEGGPRLSGMATCSSWNTLNALFAAVTAFAVGGVWGVRILGRLRVMCSCPRG